MAAFSIHRSNSSRLLLSLMNFAVLVLSIILISWISVDTFNNVAFLDNHAYMTFQFWVCIFFMLDFIVQVACSDNRWLTFRHRIIYFLLSIPYLNIISLTGIHLSPDAIYFVRFIPLARAALAMSIVVGYLSKNAISSLFLSYIVIMLMIAYFGSLIFYQREHGINPQVDTYWTALWWTGMNLVTVGSAIQPVTVAGKIIATALPIAGMIIFPLFTVYLTDYVTRATRAARSSSSVSDGSADSGHSGSGETMHENK